MLYPARLKLFYTIVEVNLRMSEDVKSMAELRQWLGDVYHQGLRANGILLISGPVFEDFLHEFDRSIARSQSLLSDVPKSDQHGKPNLVATVNSLVGQPSLADQTGLGSNGDLDQDQGPDNSDDDGQQTIEDAFSNNDDSDQLVDPNETFGELDSGENDIQDGSDLDSYTDLDSSDVMDSTENGDLSDTENNNQSDLSEDDELVDHSDDHDDRSRPISYADLDDDDQVTPSEPRGPEASDVAQSVLYNGGQSVMHSLDEDKLANQSLDHLQPSASSVMPSTDDQSGLNTSLDSDNNQASDDDDEVSMDQPNFEVDEPVEDDQTTAALSANSEIAQDSGPIDFDSLPADDDDTSDVGNSSSSNGDDDDQPF